MVAIKKKNGFGERKGDRIFRSGNSSGEALFPSAALLLLGFGKETSWRRTVWLIFSRRHIRASAARGG